MGSCRPAKSNKNDCFNSVRSPFLDDIGSPITHSSDRAAMVRDRIVHHGIDAPLELQRSKSNIAQQKSSIRPSQQLPQVGFHIVDGAHVEHS